MNEALCKVVVLASGTGTNFKAIAEACKKSEVAAKIVCLITDNPDAPALGVAKSFEIDTHVLDVPKKGGLPTEAEEEAVAVCRRHGVDLVVLAGFMRILKGPLLSAFAGRIMNIHPALLPSFKGLHAVRQTLEYGAKVAGCTVHFVDRTIDGGAIILQSAIPVEENDTEETLLERIHVEEHRTYVRAVDLFARGRLKLEGRRVRILDRDQVE